MCNFWGVLVAHIQCAPPHAACTMQRKGIYSEFTPCVHKRGAAGDSVRVPLARTNDPRDTHVYAI